MKCKAIKKAYYNKHLVYPGETVNYTGTLPLPSWLEEIKPEVAVVEEKPVAEVEDFIQTAIDDNLEELRSEAKELGYKFYRNAGKEKLQDYVAKHKK